MSTPLPQDPTLSTLHEDWARAHDPGNTGLARDLLESYERPGRGGQVRANRILDHVRESVAALGLPVGHLPWAWDTVGHRLAVHAPRQAGQAYVRARTAETEHGLAVEPRHAVENTLLFARYGALPARELAAHQRRLVALFPPPEAHREFVRLLDAWSGSGAALPADLPSLLRASTKEAGLGDGERAQVLGRVLAAARGREIPERVLREAEKLFAKTAPPASARPGLAELFPDTITDGASWLRILEVTGIHDDLAEGRIVPEGGPGAWLSRFHRMYNARWVGQGVTRQNMPDELYALLPRIAPHIRAAGAAVSLTGRRYNVQERTDHRLAEACRAEGIEVEVVPSHRPAPHVSGPRVSESRVSEPAPNPVADRIARIRDHGLGSAQEALTELDRSLNHEDMRGLGPLEDELAGLDLAAPLARTLRFGVPGEYGWPAFEAAVAEVGARDGGVVGMTSTWPVLTVHGRDTAVAVDHEGHRALARFSLPEGWEEARVHYAGGDFLVVWGTSAELPGPAPRPWRTSRKWTFQAYWASAPQDVFEVSGPGNNAHSCVFEAPDGGRYDGEGILRPGDRRGPGGHRRQFSDGVRIWADTRHHDRTVFEEIDPATGQPGESSPRPAASPASPATSPGSSTATSATSSSSPDSSDSTATAPVSATASLPSSPSTSISTAPSPASPASSATPSPAPSHGPSATTSPAPPSSFLASFLAPESPPENSALVAESSSLVPLPPGATGSPLGSTDGVAGFRVWRTPRSHRDDGPRTWTVEGVDGRRHGIGRNDRGSPWGIARFPGGGSDGLLLRWSPVRGLRWTKCVDTGDGSLMWQVTTDPTVDLHGVHGPGHLPLYPPALYWHHLRPRDPGASQALRGVDEETARQLIEAAVSAEDPATAVREALARLLPSVTDTDLIDGEGGIVWAVLWAARLLEHRTGLSRRIGLVRTGALVRPVAAAPDTELGSALSGISPIPSRWRGQGPDTLTDITAGGARLRGDIGEEVRWLSVPEAPDQWAGLFGTIDRALWPLAAGALPQPQHDALIALVRTWAEQPFAEHGTAWRTGSAKGSDLIPMLADGRTIVAGRGHRRGRRGYVKEWTVGGPPDPHDTYDFLQRAEAPAPKDCSQVAEHRVGRDSAGRLRSFLDELEKRGPVAVETEAVRLFRERTGTSRPVAEFVLSGRMGRPKAEPDTANSSALAEYRRALKKLPGFELPEAAMPDDPAELWEPGGTVALAERMARVWVELVGGPPTDRAKAVKEREELFKRDLDLPATWAEMLADPSPRDQPTGPGPRMLVQNKYGSVNLHHTRVDGRPGDEIHHFTADTGPFSALASLLVWALVQLPVGSPHAAGVPWLYERLDSWTRDPDFLVPLRDLLVVDDASEWKALFGPGAHEVAPADDVDPDAPATVVHDDGVLLVPSEKPRQFPFLRPAGLREPGALERTLRTLRSSPGLAAAVPEVLRTKVVCDGGLARMVQRAANTPVPVGGFEADPRLSVPELVGEVAAKLGTDTDAAALHLQILTLARPTDRNVRRWNGWSAKQHREVAQRLVTTGAVGQEKRPRAGRTLFAHGGWTDLRAPALPLETAKLETHLLEREERKLLHAPLLGQLPPAPLHEMFAQAWEAQVSETSR